MHVEKSFWLFSWRIKLFRPFTAKSHHTSAHVAELPGGSSGSLYLPNRLTFPRLFSVFISCNLLLFSVCLAQLHKCSVFAREPPEPAEVNNCKRCVTTAVLRPPSLQASVVMTPQHSQHRNVEKPAKIIFNIWNKTLFCRGNSEIMYCTLPPEGACVDLEGSQASLWSQIHPNETNNVLIWCDP